MSHSKVVVQQCHEICDCGCRRGDSYSPSIVRVGLSVHHSVASVALDTLINKRVQSEARFFDTQLAVDTSKLCPAAHSPGSQQIMLHKEGTCYPAVSWHMASSKHPCLLQSLQKCSDGHILRQIVF